MLLHLAWRRNLDGYDVAVAANRLASRGAPLWWLGASGPRHEPGDYLCDVTPVAAQRLAAFGIAAEPWNEELPDEAVAIAHPRIALFAGRASAYPFFAYYAMALARLGFDFELVDGPAIAEGVLARCDLLVLPTEFSVWGLDAAEGVEGADAAVREFFAGGGAAVGSGGGAFYLSTGRPGWTNVALVRPVFSHEYLRTGVGIVSVQLAADSIGFGCPPTVEMPYYHGPVFAELDRAVSAAGSFDRLVMPGHLFVANPLDDGFFRREMHGHAAIVRAETRRGRAVLFSANPEMGDLIRKYIALDGYIAHYLPIRGEAAMADALRHYRPLETPSWRVILNAIHSLMLRFEPPGAMPAPPVPSQPPEPKRRLTAALDAALRRVKPDGGAPLHTLIGAVRDDLRERAKALAERLSVAEGAFAALDPPAPGIRYLWSGCEEAALAAIAEGARDERPLAERLAELETALVLGEAWCRLAEGERHFGRVE
ncbi:MAG TPA: hypothetical protein VG308_11945 [Stellaceae bacterium]|jgi:hypothetical protein|nr:hypothetical protein [Stellaceae bacterium]